VPGQIGAIEGALSDLEKVMKGDDKDAIESRIATLEQAAQSLAAAAQAGGGQPGADAGAQAGGSAPKDDVVDAEFTEVKDKK
jgi:molecular chaperone DnaK